MKNSHQLFLAFFIPFAAALMLLSLGNYLFEDWTVYNQSPVERAVSYVKTEYIDKPIKKEVRGENVTFSSDYGVVRDPLTVEYLYGLLIFSLFILSVVLPFYVITGSKPIENSKLRLND